MTHRRGYSLIELLMVVAVLGVLAGAAIVCASGGQPERLQVAAEIVAGDVAYCRSLAVTYNSTYVMTFAVLANRYTTKHSGSNPALDTLPKAIFADSWAQPTVHATDLNGIPSLAGEVRLAAVRTGSGGSGNTTTVEFGPLGQTTRTDATTIWLAIGSRSAKRFISIEIDPVTGLTSIGDVQATVPAGVTNVADTESGGAQSTPVGS